MNKHFNEDQHSYLDHTFLKKEEHDKLHEKINNNIGKLTNRVNLIYAIINKVALPISLALVGAIIKMIFDMIQK